MTISNKDFYPKLYPKFCTKKVRFVSISKGNEDGALKIDILIELGTYVTIHKLSKVLGTAYRQYVVQTLL